MYGGACNFHRMAYLPLCRFASYIEYSKGWTGFTLIVPDLPWIDSVSGVTRNEGTSVSESHPQVSRVIVSGS